MSSPSRQPSPPPRRPAGEWTLGYVPLTHAAPLLAAQHLGLFARHGLRVRLCREIGWATIREKLLSGELDAAQALAPMPLAMTHGLNSARVDCLTALVLNRHGNTVVLSRRLPVPDAATPGCPQLPERSGEEPYTFAVVYPHSTQSFLLRAWLRQAGLMPDRDYRLVVVPPPQVVSHLKAGHIDGFCVGEPWGSMAARSGAGFIAALSADLAPGHAEKVLLVRRDRAEQRPEEHQQLIRALLDACAWCAHPAHHEEAVSLLASRNGLALPPEVLRPALTGLLNLGAGRSAHRPDVLTFHGPKVNRPTLEDAAWLARQLDLPVDPDLLSRLYRTDLHDAAIAGSSPVPVPDSEPGPEAAVGAGPVTVAHP
ncbi:MAG: ABC transporter substrate-binding protein [Verrucomicrobiae bacterium]|nr:ABC transporter substrate-binding protein [Verrucomicrobiae bacterium]